MTVNATPIQISTSIGNYEIDLLQAQTAEASDLLQDQVWYNDQDLADEFAELIFDGFGIVNQFDDGPYFVYEMDFETQWFRARFWWSQFNSVGTTVSPFANRVYAVATAVELPESATLVLMGIGLFVMKHVRRRGPTLAA